MSKSARQESASDEATDSSRRTATALVQDKTVVISRALKQQGTKARVRRRQGQEESAYSAKYTSGLEMQFLKRTDKC